ncbi:hypothetical protein [Streptomyces sp. CC77]|uniref:hypothetical protein n=1 Tax=Streptomyces sp. CC77 TaxID=1906739 RepID=UPI0008DE088E|nr:hypothetical protein [Streptomyces sp. CC77]OII68267.1 hypothetical protein BJP39_00440 [Streptomyces sp. CC77]
MREDEREEGPHMPPRSKVRNHDEAKRWLLEGKSYAWMVKKYLEKYNVETTTGYWATYANRAELPLRIVRDTDLIPWKIADQHRWDYNLVMLRAEARKRAKHKLSDEEAAKLESWKEWLKQNSLVIYYDAETEDGFFAVPREDRDTDLIRVPTNPAQLRSKTTRTAKPK